MPQISGFSTTVPQQGRDLPEFFPTQVASVRKVGNFEVTITREFRYADRFTTDAGPCRLRGA